MLRAAVGLLAGLLLAGCGTMTVTDVVTVAGGCHVTGQGLFEAPDRSLGCTPGAWISDSNVSSAHVCVHGYNPRPATSVTEPLKHQAERLYGETSAVDHQTEADHYFPRWAGGATTLANFWPEPNYPQPHGLDNNPKDKLEFVVYKLTCRTHQLTVMQARQIFQGDWRDGYARYVGLVR